MIWRSECAGCHEPLSEEEISEGAELCSNCELKETGKVMIYIRFGGIGHNLGIIITSD